MNKDNRFITEAYRTIREQKVTPTSPQVEYSRYIQANKMVDEILHKALVPYKNKMTFYNFLNTLREFTPTTAGLSTSQQQSTKKLIVTQDMELDKMLDQLMQFLGIPYSHKQQIYSTLTSLRHI